MSSLSFDCGDPLCYFGPLLHYYPSAPFFFGHHLGWRIEHSFNPSPELLELKGYQRACIERFGEADPNIYEKAAWMLLSDFGAFCSRKIVPSARGAVRLGGGISKQGIRGKSDDELWRNLITEVRAATVLTLQVKPDRVLHYSNYPSIFISEFRYEAHSAHDPLVEVSRIKARRDILESFDWARWLIVKPSERSEMR